METENTKPENPNVYACVTEHYIQEGITLRDHFAGLAMQTILKHNLEKGMHMTFDAYANVVSPAAYSVADSMLLQRQNQ